MFTFYLNMQKRRDGKVYADLHKTDGSIYFTAEDAQAAIDADPELKPYRHVVEMVAMTVEDYEEQSKEIADLRAELEALKRQEPVAYRHRDGMLSKRLPGGPVLGIDWVPLYAAPVPQPENDASDWPVLTPLHLQAITFAYEKGFAAGLTERNTENVFAKTGSQSAAFDIGLQAGRISADRGCVAFIDACAESGTYVTLLPGSQLRHD